MAGLISAIVGGIVVSLISGSHVTINGPAAGLIVVVLSSIDRLGGGALGYRGTLAAIIVSGAILTLLGLLKAGELGKAFPSSVIHGMLAAIGIIVMSKQLPYLLGVSPPSREPLELLFAIPSMLAHLNWNATVIGFISLMIVIFHGRFGNVLKKIPAAIIVIVTATLISNSLGFDGAQVPKVGLPLNATEGVTMPDFTTCSTYPFWLCVLSITLVQGLESLLSCSAAACLDPHRRPVNLSRDVTAVGIGSMVSAMIGGLPIIAEIVRSATNISNGARTRFSNFFHGVFVLLALLTAIPLINRIPLAALAALLLVTGYKLAAPKVFKQVHSIGVEQTIIFVVTILATLATDLLIGALMGIATKVVLHIVYGAPLPSFFRAKLTWSEQADGSIDVRARGALIFSNYLFVKALLHKLPAQRRVRLDLTHTDLIDHSVMENLCHFSDDYGRSGGSFSLCGLDHHLCSSAHPLAARRFPSRSLVNQAIQKMRALTM